MVLLHVLYMELFIHFMDFMVSLDCPTSNQHNLTDWQCYLLWCKELMCYDCVEPVSLVQFNHVRKWLKSHFSRPKVLTVTDYLMSSKLLLLNHNLI